MVQHVTQFKSPPYYCTHRRHHIYTPTHTHNHTSFERECGLRDFSSSWTWNIHVVMLYWSATTTTTTATMVYCLWFTKRAENISLLRVWKCHMGCRYRIKRGVNVNHVNSFRGATCTICQQHDYSCVCVYASRSMFKLLTIWVTYYVDI